MMADETPQPTVINNPSTNLVAINTAAQLPVKLSSANYPSWRAQFHSLLFGYDILGFLDGSHPCPPATTTAGTVTSPNPAYILWQRQDQLLLHAILASLSNTIMPLLASAPTSRDAWDRAARIYANKSHSRILHLKDRLHQLSKGSTPVSEYLQTIKCISDELALINAPLPDDDLILYTLNGLGPDFKELTAAIRAREMTISFEKLHDKLVEHKTLLARDDRHGSSPVSVHSS